MLAAEFNWAYIADIVFILILIIWAIIDARKGFITCFFSFISTIVAVLVVVLFSASITDWTNGLFGLRDLLGEGIGNGLSSVAPFNIDISTEGIAETIGALALPDFIKDAVLTEVTAVIESAGMGGLEAGTLLGQFVGQEIAGFLASTICAIVLFFLVKLIMLIVRGILNKVAENAPIFQKINLIGGMFVGLFKGFLAVCGLLAILSLIPAEGLVNFFDSTLMLGGLYHNNPIMAIFGLFMA
ncbi:MAG: CvpA family protein [Clostridia bacterium]|nr:CvpA family protein [Clostridia bacterium]